MVKKCQNKNELKNATLVSRVWVLGNRLARETGPWLRGRGLIHMYVGFVESLGQYKASEALVSWFHCVITHIYIYAHISTCMYTYIYAMTQCNPRSMVENYQTTEWT